MKTDEGARHLKAFNRIGLGAGLGISCLLLITAWGNWRHVAFVVGLLVVVGWLNLMIGWKLIPRIGPSASEDLRAGLNLAASLASAHILGWPLASWLYLPFACIFVNGEKQTRARVRLAVAVAVWIAFAFAGGATLETVAVFAGIGVLGFWASSARIGLIEEVLAGRAAQNTELAAAHEELKAMHAHALAQERLAGLGLLAAGVAHEINNPMSYVTANIKALLVDLKDAGPLTSALTEQRDEVIPDTLDGVRRVNAIVNDLRRFASGEREEPTGFNLRDEVDAAVRIVQLQLKPGQTIRVDFPESLIVFGMPRQMGQVLLNLLVNAAQALPATGSIVASGSREGENIQIAIADNGTGMSADTLGKIWNPFFTTKEIGKGTGLGLPVVHGIVRAHDGAIAVRSTLGQGTTFTLTLPKTMPPALQQAA